MESAYIFNAKAINKLDSDNSTTKSNATINNDTYLVMVAKEADVNHTTMHIKATTSSDNSTTTSTLSPTTTKKPVHSISAPLSPVGPEPSDSEWKFQVKLSNSFRSLSN